MHCYTRSNQKIVMFLFVWLLIVYSACATAKSVAGVVDAEDAALDLTPLIERGEASKARSQSAVDPALFAGVPSHAAFITANHTRNWHLFFWFFPVENQPLDTTPWIIWLQGGPGVTSLYGLFTEIGPIMISVDQKVKKMPITWSSNYSLLFIDNPVGAGFSYSDDDSKAETEDDVGNTLLSFIEQFLQVFPELQKAPLFIAGESYAGKFIPAFGHYIHNRKNRTIPINLKGLAIGDGVTDPPSLTHFSEWGAGTGLLDFKQANALKPHEEAARKLWEEGKIEEYKKEISQALYNPPENELNGYNYMDRFMLDQLGPMGNYTVFLSHPDVRKAIHVGDKVFNDYKKMMENDLYLSVKPWLEELLDHYGVMCYSGQLDIFVAYAVSMYTYKSLKWSGQAEYLNTDRKAIWGPTLFENKTVIGYEKSFGNFMDVLLLGSGHMVPHDQPRSAKIIIDKFISKFK